MCASHVLDDLKAGPKINERGVANSHNWLQKIVFSKKNKNE